MGERLRTFVLACGLGLSLLAVGAGVGCQELIDLGEASGDAGASTSIEDAAADASARLGDASIDRNAAPPDDAGPPPPSNDLCVPPPNVAQQCPPFGDAGASCPDDGGVTWNGHCYFLLNGSEHLVDQATAAADCQALGAHLATLTCESEWAATTLLITSGINAWLGGHADGARCAWSDGEPWTFASWARGEPFDASAPNDCIWEEPGGGWHALDCAATSALPLCERP